ncbi:uncharacterized protein LOC127722355 [Mytilus californianus]|uniref:uncharacterized protein LOC127722355 n=1 Tax=Mytilus californianus TaxID=6549 RepID=UPI00224656E6|nr:uncharacterized protein LOC127722355 [Mytilus californianus]
MVTLLTLSIINVISNSPFVGASQGVSLAQSTRATTASNKATGEKTVLFSPVSGHLTATPQPTRSSKVGPERHSPVIVNDKYLDTINDQFSTCFVDNDYIESFLDQVQYFENCQSYDKFKGVKGRLACHVKYWENIGACPFVLDTIKNGYVIPFIDTPFKMYHRNNRSARQNTEFVTKSIEDLVQIGCVIKVPFQPYVVNPLSVATQKSDIFSVGHWSDFNSQVASNNDLSSLFKQLPEFLLSSKAASTQKKYRYAFNSWCKWTSQYSFSPLPASHLHISLYLIHLSETAKSVSKLNDAFYAIKWAHKLAGVADPSENNLVASVLEGAHRKIGHSVVKKEPITPHILKNIVCKYANNTCNLKDLRIASGGYCNTDWRNCQQPCATKSNPVSGCIECSCPNDQITTPVAEMSTRTTEPYSTINTNSQQSFTFSITNKPTIMPETQKLMTYTQTVKPTTQAPQPLVQSTEISTKRTDNTEIRFPDVFTTPHVPEPEVTSDKTTRGTTLHMIVCAEVFDCDLDCYTGYSTDDSGCPLCKCAPLPTGFV